jgi:hypothetical protein
MAKYTDALFRDPRYFGSAPVPARGFAAVLFRLSRPVEGGVKCCVGATKSAPLAASIHIIVEHRASELAY